MEQNFLQRALIAEAQTHSEIQLSRYHLLLWLPLPSLWITAVPKPPPVHTPPWLHPEDPLEMDTLDHTQKPLRQGVFTCGCVMGYYD